jgi:hypothetical protein
VQRAECEGAPGGVETLGEAIEELALGAVLEAPHGGQKQAHGSLRAPPVRRQRRIERLDPKGG